MKKKRVVVIGGGNGAPVTIRALKETINYLNIAAVVSVADSGRANGRIRKEFKMIPPSDLMRVVLAMSKFDFTTLWKVFYKNRFVGKYNEHNLGTLFLALSNHYTGQFMPGLLALEQSLNVVGHVYPATLESVHLCVQLSNGKIVKTEGVIDRPKYNRSLRIMRAWLEPNGNIYHGARKVLENANYIIIGPGSLYTSHISTLLVKGVKEAINKSSAKLIYICPNHNSAIGETGPVQVSDFVKELELYLPRPVDCVIYNTDHFSQLAKKQLRRIDLLPITVDPENLKGKKFIGKHWCDYGSGHPIKMLGRVLRKIVV